jgi:hypothetical protein
VANTHSLVPAAGGAPKGLQVAALGSKPNPVAHSRAVPAPPEHTTNRRQSWGAGTRAPSGLPLHTQA